MYRLLRPKNAKKWREKIVSPHLHQDMILFVTGISVTLNERKPEVVDQVWGEKIMLRLLKLLINIKAVLL